MNGNRISECGSSEAPYIIDGAKPLKKWTRSGIHKATNMTLVSIKYKPRIST